LHPFQFGGGVVGGLILDGGEVQAEGFLFGLDDADGVAVDEEGIIGGAGIGGVFAHGLAGAFVGVEGVFILHDPAAGAKLRINLIASDLLGVLVGSDGELGDLGVRVCVRVGGGCAVLVHALVHADLFGCSEFGVRLG
jgi:hypothetical protein